MDSCWFPASVNSNLRQQWGLKITLSSQEAPLTLLREQTTWEAGIILGHCTPAPSTARKGEGWGEDAPSSLPLSPGHPSHHLPDILLMTQLAGCHLLNRFHNHDPEFGNHGLRWAYWLAVQKLLLLLFFKPTVPSILRRSPIQVITRPRPCLVSEIRQDRVHTGWYGWRQKSF